MGHSRKRADKQRKTLKVQVPDQARDRASTEVVGDLRMIDQAAYDRKHRLYQQAVQSPKGDISYMLRFFRENIGMQAPVHLREDFCGTAAISATWCKSDVRRTATGVDLDAQALRWGWQNNACSLLGGSAARVCLVHSNVLSDIAEGPVVRTTGADLSGPALSDLQAAEHANKACHDDDGARSDCCDAETDDLRCKPADIVCFFNFSVCLLFTRSDVLRYFRHVRQAINPEGGVFVLDLLGGPAAEVNARIQRRNDVTGMTYLWEQVGYNPVTRHIHTYITLCDPETKQVLPRAFAYHWRLWTLPDVLELLRQAGFPLVEVWLRPIKDAGAEQTGMADGEDTDYERYDLKGSNAELIGSVQGGWTAYVVAVVPGDASV
ncbi:hypothetical protein WJX72_007255 [[Myrmecia] bisecta]|uniref:Uncharacterized protein n=1 Tax=[Myrmecia] bisecta TaxID=41462 RepID=A0AAW1R781_9CHLO